MGQVLTAGAGQNPARQAAIEAGLPVEVPAMTVNKVCGSGMKSVQLAVQAIRCGDAEIIVAGGQENMNLAPHVLPGSRIGMRMGEWKLIDSMINEGLWDIFNDYHMGCTAENLVDRYQHHPRGAGRLRRRVPAEGGGGAKGQPVRRGNRYRSKYRAPSRPHWSSIPTNFPDTAPQSRSLAEAAGRRSDRERHGDPRQCLRHQRRRGGGAGRFGAQGPRTRPQPLATIAAYSNAGVDPGDMGIGPVPATRRCLDKAGWQRRRSRSDRGQRGLRRRALAVSRELGWDTGKVNVNGGAIALGPPDRRLGRADPGDPAARNAQAGRAQRARHPVHRRRPGRGASPSSARSLSQRRRSGRGTFRLTASMNHRESDSGVKL